MTRADEAELKKERNRKMYAAHKEQYKARARKWYWDNREHALQKAALYREKLRRNAKFTAEAKPSIDAIEANLPRGLREKIPTLRSQFLNIPILQRPPYDEYLRDKTIEYLKSTNNERGTETSD